MSDSESDYSLPLYAPSQKRQYDGQTETTDSFCLLLIEVLHRGKVFKNEECGKKSRSQSRKSV